MVDPRCIGVLRGLTHYWGRLYIFLAARLTTVPERERHSVWPDTHRPFFRNVGMEFVKTKNKKCEITYIILRIVLQRNINLIDFKGLCTPKSFKSRFLCQNTYNSFFFLSQKLKIFMESCRY